MSTERPSILFDLATAWLIERKILLPGVSVLARLVASVRDRAAARLWHAVSAIPNKEQRTRLDGLLIVPAGARASALDRLRRAPTRASAPSLVDAFRLRPGELGRVKYNWRYSHGYWLYERWTFNIVLLSQGRVEPRVFVECSPSHVLTRLSRLF